MVVVANYMFGFSFSYYASHLKGEEVFGLLNDLLIVFLAQTMIIIVLTMWISFIHK